MKVRSLLLLLLFFLMLMPSAAGEEKEDLEEGSLEDEFDLLQEQLLVGIEVSSTKPETIFNTPSTVSIIDRSTIEMYGFTSVSEAVSSLAGVSVMRTFLMRDIPTIRGILQEHFANKVLILIDGVPAWMAVTGDGNINRIDIKDVERIEVLKGPASVLYGTNAYSGAINLVLKKIDPDNIGPQKQGEVRVRIGEWHLLHVGGSFLYADEKLSVFITANGATIDGPSKTFTGEEGKQGQIKNFQENINISSSARYRTSYGVHGLLFNGYSAGESFFGVVPAYLHGAGNLQKKRGYLVHYNYQFDLGDIGDLLLGESFDWNERDFSRKDDDLVRTTSTGYRIQSYLKSTLCLADWLEVEFGADVDWRHADKFINYDVMTVRELSDNNMTDRGIWELSLLSQAEISGKDLPIDLPLKLLLGVRGTNNELFNWNTSLRGTLVYTMTEKSSIKIVAGQSFRAPTLFELYFQSPSSTLSVYGNPDLQPERSNSVECSFLMAKGDFFTQVLGYYSTYDQKIIRVRKNPDNPNDKSLFYVNGKEFAAWGAEVELKYQNPDYFNTYLNYTFVQGNSGEEVDGNGHYNFKYIPEHMASLGISRRFSAFFISTAFNYIHSCEGPLGEIGPQFTWDINLGYQSKWGKHTLHAKNILDEQVLVPEYVRFDNDKINAYPSQYGRLILYSFEYVF